MPTLYPKCSPTEMMGLLVLLNDHKGSEDVALLADDLDLEIDEIFPSLEWAEALGLVSVKDGRATFTEAGRQLIAGSITQRKVLLREQLKKSTLFRALIHALEAAPSHRLAGDEVTALISFTSAPADALIQNIINWGRYAEVFRYDSDAGVLLPVKASAGSRPTPRPARPGKISPSAAGTPRTGAGSPSSPKPSVAPAKAPSKNSNPAPTPPTGKTKSEATAEAESKNS